MKCQVKLFFSDSIPLSVSFRGSFEDAKAYYLGKNFEVGKEDGVLSECIGIENLSEVSASPEKISVVKVFFNDGDSLVSRINLDYEGAKRYYLGKWFNLGSVEDRMAQAVKVELVEVIKA